VVAYRLSKNSKVLLLEAGGDPSPLNNIPLLAADLLGHSSTDWMYETVSQKNACIGFQNQVRFHAK
jgi:choline dehydrogenase-like flavoprotein